MLLQKTLHYYEICENVKGFHWNCMIYDLAARILFGHAQNSFEDPKMLQAYFIQLKIKVQTCKKKF